MSRFPVFRSLRAFFVLPIGIGGLVALMAASSGDDRASTSMTGSRIPAPDPPPAAPSARTAPTRADPRHNPTTQSAGVGRRPGASRRNIRATEDLSAYVEVWPEAEAKLEADPTKHLWIALSIRRKLREDEKPLVDEILDRKNAVVAQTYARLQELREEIIARRRAERTLLPWGEYHLRQERGTNFVLTRRSTPAYFSLRDQLNEMRGMMPDDEARRQALRVVARAMRDEEERSVREGLYEARFDDGVLVIKTEEHECLALPNAEEAAAILELDGWIREVQRQAQEELRRRLDAAAN